MPRKAGGGGGGGRSYVNNSMNRSLGRVGMAVGSAPVSRSTCGSSGSSGYGSTGGQRAYVDNSMNRSLGRVGMTVGSAPVSRSTCESSGSSGYESTGGQRAYVDNSMNRNLGRVGMTVGSMPVSRSTERNNTTTSGNGNNIERRTYVDNSMNRNIGRVGLPVGSAVVSRSSERSASSQNTYVDNSFNKLHGRVGKPHGTAVISKRSSYSAPFSKEPPKQYVDNSLNRRLGRVGKPLGSMPVSKNSQRKEVIRAYHELNEYPDDRFQQYQETQRQLDPNVLQMIEEMFQRMKIWERERKVKSYEYASSHEIDHKTQKAQSVHFASYKGEVVAYEEIVFNSNKRIGHGGFGDVFAAKYDDKNVAVKKLRVQRVSKKRLAQFEEEVRIFAKLNHANIIKFYGACIKTPNLCMVMELMEASLFDKLHIEECQFTNEDKCFIANGIANGLLYLHSMEIAHCDVKSSNVLLDTFEGKSPHVKLTDFGLSMMKNDSETSSSHKETMVAGIGTPRYAAPEVLRGEFLDRGQMKMADVYSFGLVVFEIFSEEEPFDEFNMQQLQRQVGHGNATPSLSSLVDGLNGRLIRMMQQCWLRQASGRPAMKDVCEILKQA